MERNTLDADTQFPTNDEWQRWRGYKLAMRELLHNWPTLSIDLLDKINAKDETIVFEDEEQDDLTNPLED